jgi:hypothetical protein
MGGVPQRPTFGQRNQTHAWEIPWSNTATSSFLNHLQNHSKIILKLHRDNCFPGWPEYILAVNRRIGIVFTVKGPLAILADLEIEPAFSRMREDGEEMLTTSDGIAGERRHRGTRGTSGKQTAPGTWRIGHHRWLPMLMMTVCFAVAAHGQQYYYVDCTHTNPSDYPSITSALQFAGPGSIILVNGPCTENVSINSAFNLNIGAYYGQTANIVGNVSVYGSGSIYLYGLNVTNASGDGFDIASSHAVTLDTCTANGNLADGLNASNGSDVTVEGPSSFDSNGSYGVNLGSNVVFYINSWSGPTDISKNNGAGVWMTSGALFETLGSTTIENNVNLPGVTQPTALAFGISMFGASKAQIGTCFGNNVIQGNQAGGINSQENSEISLWNCGQPYQSYVLANGPVGISAGLGSQVTLYDDVQISGHSGEGIELWGKSQLNVFEQNLITQNGTASDRRSAGIVVDGNSEAYLRGGQITMNEGPGMLVLVNSSADFTGATFSGNSAGIITCDSSAYMVSDLATNSNAGISCLTPHKLGNRVGYSGGRPPLPNFTAQNNKHAWYKQLAVAKK